MIDKIIHLIWLQGFDKLPDCNEYKSQSFAKLVNTFNYFNHQSHIRIL